MGLLDKSNKSHEVAVLLKEQESFDQSIHHCYYALLQLLLAILYSYYGETPESLGAAGKGSHDAAINKIHTLLGWESRDKKHFKKQFHWLKNRRKEADYSDSHLSLKCCQKCVSKSQWARTELLKEYEDKI